MRQRLSGSSRNFDRDRGEAANVVDQERGISAHDRGRSRSVAFLAAYAIGPRGILRAVKVQRPTGERSRSSTPRTHGVLPMAIGALTVFAVLFLFESSVHSVHHIGEMSAAAECPVAAAVPQLAGISPEAPHLESPFLVIAPLVVSAAIAAAPSELRTTPFGRAPPTASFV